MTEFCMTYAQTVMRYPLYCFERIINAIGMYGVFISVFIFVIVMIKVVHRFTSK